MQIKKSKRWPRKVIRTFINRPMKKGARKKRLDLSGKFVILLNSGNKKIGALLKFMDQTTCEVVTCIFIKKCDLKQTSKKFIISTKRHKKLLKTIEVVVNLKLERKYRKYQAIYEKTIERLNKEAEVKANKKKHKAIAEAPKAVVPIEVKKLIPPVVNHVPAKPVNAVPTIPKIKIFSCVTCNHKFTKQSMYEDHVKTHQPPDSSDSETESETELVIDDDVMLVLQEDLAQPSGEQQNEEKPDKFICMNGLCQKQFDTEQALICHIGIHHEKDEMKKFQCKECPLIFTREASMIAHSKISHTVATEPEEPEPAAKPRLRRKSMYVDGPSKAKASTSKQDSVPFTPSADANGKITFERYNSKYKRNYVCRICSTSFQIRQLLDRHVQVQHISKLYYCYKCSAALSMLSLFSHMKTAHADCSNEIEYRTTMKEAETVSVFRCAFCQYLSRMRDRVETHLRYEHYEEFERSDDKDLQASSSDSLEELVQPATAKMIAELESDLKKTELERRARRPLNDPSFKFRCGRCQRRFVKSTGLKNHKCERQVEAIPKPPIEIARVEPATPAATGNGLVVVNGFHRCPRCPSVFTDLGNLRTHVSIAHNMEQTPKTGFYGTIIN